MNLLKKYYEHIKIRYDVKKREGGVEDTNGCWPPPSVLDTCI